MSRKHGNHGNEENHGNPGCKPLVTQTTGLELPDNSHKSELSIGIWFHEGLCQGKNDDRNCQ